MEVKNRHLRKGSPIPDDPIGLSVVGVRPGSAQGRRYSSSPIPPDPSDSHSSFSDRSSRPRVKPEAMKIARNNQGEAIAQLFNPKFRVIPLGGRPVTAESKDFGKENYVKIKQIQRESRQKQREKRHVEPVKAVYKPGKFDHVASKVSENISVKDDSVSRQRPSSANFLRAHSRSGPMVDITKRPDSAPAPCIDPKKLTVPTSADCRERFSEPKRSENHIKKNIKKAPAARLKRSPSLSALDELKQKKETDFNSYKRGAIPSYLTKRREEWTKAEEERLARIPDPSIPAGHTLMPKQEQKETLDTLTKSQTQMLTELRGLPLSKDTVRVKQRRELLEKKLKEVELALKVFSRPKVFIKDG